jgi:16S rRNA (adenine1518-N6/adenine1519-N6)-dimethyltransferase
VVELDRDVIPLLRERCASLGELVIHAQDVLRFDFCPPPAGQRWRVIGNLPYNISTPLLFHLAGQAHCLQDLTVMLQREVAQRIAAAPGGAEYGRLSVMLAWHFQHELLFDLGPGAFQPPPKVWSSVLRLVPHASPPAALDDPAWLGRVVTAAFGQRRKTLRNALAPLLTATAIAAAEVNPGARAETLDLAAFARLANAARRAAAGLVSR